MQSNTVAWLVTSRWRQLTTRYSANAIQTGQQPLHTSAAVFALSCSSCMSCSCVPTVCLSAQVFTKSGAEQQLVQRAVDLKRLLVAALEKHRELQIEYKARVRQVVSGSLLFTVVSVVRDTAGPHLPSGCVVLCRWQHEP